jgi:hypothetical protein
MKWAWYMAHLGERRYAYMAFVSVPEEKKPLKRPRHGWSLIET